MSEARTSDSPSTMPLVEISDEFADAIGEWRDASVAGFWALKMVFDLPDSWSFSIASPDTPTTLSGTNTLQEPRGTAAFILRRIQALRFVLQPSAEGSLPRVSLDLACGYSSDIGEYLFGYLTNPDRTHTPELSRLWVATNQLTTHITTHI